MAEKSEEKVQTVHTVSFRVLFLDCWLSVEGGEAGHSLIIWLQTGMAFRVYLIGRNEGGECHL